MKADGGAIDVKELLNLTDTASDKFTNTVEHLGEQGIDQASRLKGWSHRMVIAHVTYVADAYQRMTDDALLVGQSATYPGGAAEREASLYAFDNFSFGEVCEVFRHSSSALIEKWRDLDLSAWPKSFVDKRFGRIKLSRLLALFLTELEVHEGDLIHGARPNKWNPDFIRVCLPLRIAWLAGQRGDANCTIQGRWVLKTDRQSWLVSASETDVVCTAADDNVGADVAISGDAADLLAFLLGRSPSSPLAVTGDAMLADRFKEAFPGP
jgi:uncharacterized protein (TIGR03083 family)